MTTTIHTMRNGFCTVCNETEAWLTEHKNLMTPAVEATSFELVDIVRIGKGATRWMVTTIEADGRITLSKIAKAGEMSTELRLWCGALVDGLKLGNNHRYVEVSEQGNLTKVSKATIIGTLAR